MTPGTVLTRLGGAVALTVGLLAGTVTPAGADLAPMVGTELVFQKNHGDQTNSRLLVRGAGGVLASYRAGSGYVKDECARQRGWLPNGGYSVLSHVRNKNSVIKGYAIHVSNRRCHNGTSRTELFIHSEMLPNGGQGGSESTRWDGVRDYRSLGCIKLHPNDIKRLFEVLDKYGWPRGLHVG